MSNEKTSLTAALRHLAEQERRTASDHATPGDLTAYHEGTLPPPVEARVREHLAHCKLCSDLLLDLAGFADLAPPPGVPELTDAELDEDWKALRARMGEAEPKPATVVPFPTAPSPRPARTFWNSPGLSVAATLLAFVGVFYGLYQRSEVQRLQRADFVRQQTLQGETRTTRSGSQDQEEPKRISAREGGEFYLDLDIDQVQPAYEAEILLDGKRILTLPATPVELDPVIIRIPGGRLKPGEYRIRLYGVAKDGARVPVDEFPFRVDDP